MSGPSQPPSGVGPRVGIQGPSGSVGPMRGPPAPRGGLPANKPVFGKSLDELFQRDGSAVPIIVYQCIQAVDLYGLNVEGIYRTSGAAHHIMELRQQFDHGELS